MIVEDGRLKWLASTGYSKRALIETAISHHKGINGRRLRARSFPAQQTEVAIGCAGHMTTCVCPEPVRYLARNAYKAASKTEVCPMLLSYTNETGHDVNRCGRTRSLRRVIRATIKHEFIYHVLWSSLYS